MKTQQLSFLNGVTLTPADIARLERPMSNWLNAHNHIRALEPNERGLHELKLMLLYELTQRQRLHMLQRLRARFNSLRMQYEDKQLVGLARSR